MRAIARLLIPLAVVASLALAGCGDSATDVPAAPIATAASVERQRSDRFWAQAIDYAPRMLDLHTLEDVVGSSDLIVRGRIGGRTTIGCSADPSPRGRPDLCEDRDRSFAIVAVEEVLKGDEHYTSGTLLVRLEFGDIDESELPHDELVLFLKNYGEFYDAIKPEPIDSPRWKWYFLATSYQGALRNLDGVVDVPDAPEGWWEDFGPFPHDIDGQPFDNVVARIRSLIGS